MESLKIHRPNSPHKERNLFITLEYLNGKSAKVVGKLFGIGHVRVVQIVNIHLMFILNKRYEELGNLVYYIGQKDIIAKLEEYGKFLKFKLKEIQHGS